jgi:hypothetical protein
VSSGQCQPHPLLLLLLLLLPPALLLPTLGSMTATPRSLQPS